MRKIHGYARTLFVYAQVLVYLVVALVGKVVFLLYNAAGDLSAGEVAGCLLAGLGLDVATAFVAVLPAWLCVAAAWRSDGSDLRACAGRCMMAVLFLSVLLIVADAVMYAYWKFKLDASIFGYMFSPGEVGASVPASYIAWRTVAFVLSVLAACGLSRLATPHGRLAKPGAAEPFCMAGFIVLLVLTNFSWHRGRESAAFHSDRLLLNHAAVNPVRHFMSSAILYAKPADRQFCLSDGEAQCSSMAGEMFPADTEDVADTLLRQTRPNIITIQLEGCGASMIETLGGHKGVTPELCRWMERGVNFTNAWATSFRTDRGTVSFVSGYVSYPTLSLMQDDDCLLRLPSLARSLRSVGYDAEYLYGGDQTVMNKEKYLLAMGFDPVLGIESIDVPRHERDSWGANDSISLNRLMGIALSKNPESPWYIGYQTISSHEPWQVPYQRLDDEVYNAFAYTDHCLGQFLDSLSLTPVWDNLLIVVFADHGVTYGLDMSDPEFFHMPLLLLGGAVREPRTIPVLVSQGDIAATLLAQMGIPHDDFPWSRNVLSRNYRYPCVYCTYPGGIMFKDATGSTFTDLYTGQVLNPGDGTTESHRERVRKISNLLDYTYSRLP